MHRALNTHFSVIQFLILFSGTLVRNTFNFDLIRGGQVFQQLVNTPRNPAKVAMKNQEELIQVDLAGVLFRTFLLVSKETAVG